MNETSYTLCIGKRSDSENIGHVQSRDSEEMGHVQRRDIRGRLKIYDIYREGTEEGRWRYGT